MIRKHKNQTFMNFHDAEKTNRFYFLIRLKDTVVNVRWMELIRRLRDTDYCSLLIRIQIHGPNVLQKVSTQLRSIRYIQ